LEKYSENMQEKIDLLEGTCKKALTDLEKSQRENKILCLKIGSLKINLMSSAQELENRRERLCLATKKAQDLEKCLILKELKILSLLQDSGNLHMSMEQENQFLQACANGLDNLKAENSRLRQRLGVQGSGNDPNSSDEIDRLQLERDQYIDRAEKAESKLECNRKFEVNRFLEYCHYFIKSAEQDRLNKLTLQYFTEKEQKDFAKIMKDRGLD
jgi:hypothetical protein